MPMRTYWPRGGYWQCRPQYDTFSRSFRSTEPLSVAGSWQTNNAGALGLWPLGIAEAAVFTDEFAIGEDFSALPQVANHVPVQP